MAKNQEFDSYCGLICATCDFRLTKQCLGCLATLGKPFHGNCAVAECAIAKKRRFCGECGDFPCDLLKKYAFDQQFGDQGARIENCRQIKFTLVKQARRGLNPVGYCSHHCDYCFYGPYCGGCRSEYNCCSYATLFTDGVCPNVKCAVSKGYTDCYCCENLIACETGYYSKKDEYAAKATALFIREYGEVSYAKTLKKAVATGFVYPQDLENTGSVAEAVKLLQSFL